jgi:nucleoside-diphosphate-sugar epimerase
MSKIITVFGATGNQGGSVLIALLKNDTFHVRAITRNANSDKAKQLAVLKNVDVHEADLNDRQSLDTSMRGAYGAFLVTDLALDEKTSQETQQGFNLIDSAVKNKVSHVVFSGLENAILTINKPCVHMDNKEKIEQYGMKKRDKINFTSIRLPMYYQVIPGMMLKKITPNEFLLTLPMSDKPAYCKHQRKNYSI